MNMIWHNLKSLDSKILFTTNVMNDLFQPVFDCACQNLSSILWAPHNMILKQIDCFIRCCVISHHSTIQINMCEFLQENIK